jgi:hypothetical protein
MFKNNFPYIKVDQIEEIPKEPAFLLPKQMLTDKRFQGLPFDAIILYLELCERTNLSESNGWIDNDGQPYIIYPREEARKMFRWGNKKTSNLFKQLKKYNLIEEIRLGLNNPNLIYVKSYQ